MTLLYIFNFYILVTGTCEFQLLRRSSFIDRHFDLLHKFYDRKA